MNNYYNCYHNCSYYYYFDIYSNYQCTNYSSCHDEYPILEEMKCKTVDQLKKLIEDLTNNKPSK